MFTTANTNNAPAAKTDRARIDSELGIYWMRLAGQTARINYDCWVDGRKVYGTLSVTNGYVSDGKRVLGHVTGHEAVLADLLPKVAGWVQNEIWLRRQAPFSGLVA